MPKILRDKSSIYSAHGGLMIGMQCQLVIVEDLLAYQKAPFENFCD